MKAIVFIIAIAVIVGLVVLISSIGRNAEKEYMTDLDNALDKPYNDLTESEQNMVDDYLQWTVENNN
jgi:hypothetical protein